METTNETLRNYARKIARKSGQDVHIPTGIVLAGYALVCKPIPHAWGISRVVTETRYAGIVARREQYERNARQYAGFPESAIYGLPYPSPDNPRTFGNDPILITSPDDVCIVPSAGDGPAAYPIAAGTDLTSVLTELAYGIPSDSDTYQLVAALTGMTSLEDFNPQSRYVSGTVTHTFMVDGNELPVTDRAEIWVVSGYPTHTRNASYLALTDTGQVSFLPAGKWSPDIRYNEYVQTTRQSGKPARVFRSVLVTPDAYSDAAYETVTNAIKAHIKRHAGTFRIVTGDDIRECYQYTRYVSGDTGTLRHSCMRHRQCWDYLEIYAANPDRISLLIRENAQSEILGRALLWHTDDDETLIDRVYGSDVTQRHFTEYATRNGYQSAYSKAAEITLQYADFDQYPYCDNFAYLTVNPDGTGILTNDESLTGDVYRTLQHTNGRYSQSDMETCPECSESFFAHDTRGSGYCPDCEDRYVCLECNEFRSYGLTDGYCSDCIRDHECRECGTYVSDSDDLTDGYCPECASDHVCRECGNGYDALSGDGYCDDCERLRCSECGTFRSWSEWYDSGQTDRCETCRATRPALFELPATYAAGWYRSLPYAYPHETRYPWFTGNCYRHHSGVPVTGYQSIADGPETDRTGDDTGTYPAFVNVSGYVTTPAFGYGNVAYRPIADTPDQTANVLVSLGLLT